MIRKIGKYLLIVIAILIVTALSITFLMKTPVNPQINVLALRAQIKQPYQLMKTSDGVTLFLRKWQPDSTHLKKNIAVIIFHGVTAHSAPYGMIGKALSNGGYTVFGLDSRGHGLSGGKRGDTPGKERWLLDMEEAVRYVKSLGFSRVVILGHSLGVAHAIQIGNRIPKEIAGLVLLSGAYHRRPEATSPPIPLLQKVQIFTSAVLRPGTPVIPYKREGMKGLDDSLRIFVYTLRFLQMFDIKELSFRQDLAVPVLVGMGDQDELFDLKETKILYDSVHASKKDLWIIKGAKHAEFPSDCWAYLVDWMNRTYP